MNKLSQIPEINHQIVMWIHDFLSNHKRKIVIKGHASLELVVTSGVPQGSVLGLVFFLAYINDLPQYMNCNISLFAYDTLIYQVVNTLQDRRAF